MAPGKKTDGGSEGTPAIFTLRDQQILLNAFMCMDDIPTVNFEHLAARCGMTNPRSASNAWSMIKKKITENSGTAPVVDHEGKVLPTMNPFAGGAKRKASSDDGDAAEGSAAPVKKTPAKRVRATPKKAAAAAAAADDGDDADLVATPTKAPRSRARVTKTPAKGKKSTAQVIDSDSEAEPIKKEKTTPAKPIVIKDEDEKVTPVKAEAKTEAKTEAKADVKEEAADEKKNIVVKGEEETESAEEI